MDTIGTIFCMFMIGAALMAFAKAMQQKKQDELRKENPEAWMRLQEMEHEKNKLRNAALSTGLKAGVGATKLIIRAVTKR